MIEVRSTPEYLGYSEQDWHDPRRKTKIWTVYQKHHPDAMILGVVRWHSGWRRYVFWPYEPTILSAGCMVALAEFCQGQTEERKALAEATRTGGRLCPTCGLPSGPPLQFHPIVGPARIGPNHCGVCGRASCPRDCW